LPAQLVVRSRAAIAMKSFTELAAKLALRESTLP
jgi:hypothetical protein